jgi:hypothetical protein
MFFRRHCCCESLATMFSHDVCHQLSNFQISGGIPCQNQKVRDAEHDIQEYYTPVLGDITATAPAELPSRCNHSKATLYGSPRHAMVNRARV